MNYTSVIHPDGSGGNIDDFLIDNVVAKSSIFRGYPGRRGRRRRHSVNKSNHLTGVHRHHGQSPPTVTLICLSAS